MHECQFANVPSSRSALAFAECEAVLRIADLAEMGLLDCLPNANSSIRASVANGFSAGLRIKSFAVKIAASAITRQLPKRKPTELRRRASITT